MAEKKAWRLIFAQGLLGNYIGSEGEWSFRKYYPGSHEFKKGQIIEGHFLDGLVLLLEVMEDTQIKPFSKITKQECKEWAKGNCTHAQMMAQMAVYHPEVTGEDTAALIKTRLARINNRPIAGPLPPK